MTGKIPSIEHIRELLAGIVGRKITASKSSRKIKGADLVVAEFNDPDGKLAALLVVDCEFACRTGAALAMMPVGIANESVKAKTLQGELKDNYHEVANVLTAVFRADEHRVVLGKIYEGAPALLKPIMRKATSRVDMDFAIDGYGDGRAAILMVE